MITEARFSEGQERAGDTCEKTRVGRFSDGQETLPVVGCNCSGDCACG